MTLFYGSNVGAPPSFQSITTMNSNGLFTLNPGVANVTGDGTLYTVPFNNTIFQNGTDVSYNSVTGLFTVNTTGVYQVYWQLGVKLASSSFTELQAYINNLQPVIYDNPGAHYENTEYNGLTYNISYLAQLNATATFSCIFKVAGGTKTVGAGGGSGSSQANFFYYVRIH